MEAGYGTIFGLDSGRCPFLSFTASPRAPLGGGVLGRVLGQPNRCIQNRKSFPDSDPLWLLLLVNLCDNHLENLCRNDQTWKVRPIEEDFHRLKWESQDV